MKAIILAAGMGRRIAAMGWHKPKCLLPCPGGTLLDNAMRAIASAGISDVVLVTGFEHAQVEAAALVHPINFGFVHNPEFGSTNTQFSAYLARKHMHGGFLLLNADVWFVPDVLTRLRDAAESRHAGGALAVQRKACGSEEVKVMLDQSNRVVRIGKDLDTTDSAGEYVGIGWFGQLSAASIARQLEKEHDKSGSRVRFVESAFDGVLAADAMIGVEIGLAEAIEIDTPADFEAACDLWHSADLTTTRIKAR